MTRMKTTKVLYGIALGLTLGLATTLKAQIYVGNSGTGTIGEYNLNGTTINASLISGVEYPTSIAISGTNLFVANSASGIIGEYTTSGATVKSVADLLLRKYRPGTRDFGSQSICHERSKRHHLRIYDLWRDDQCPTNCWFG